MADLSTYLNGGNETEEKSNYYYAGFLERCLANTVDGVLVIVYSLILLKIFGSFINPNFIIFSNIVGNLVLIGISYLYFIFFLSVWGMTPGKKLFGLKVLKKDFTKLSLPRTILREVVGRFAAGAASLSYLAIIFSSRKRGLHDLIGGTIVVRNSPRTSYQRTVYLLLIGLLILLPFIGVALIAVLGTYNSYKNTGPDFRYVEPKSSSGITVTSEATPTIGFYRNLTPVPQPSYLPIPSVGPTDDWNTFTNVAYRYSIKYPFGSVYKSVFPDDYSDAGISPNVRISSGSTASFSPWEIEIDMGQKKSADVNLVDFARKDIDSNNSYRRPEVPKFVILYTAVINGHNAVFSGNNSPDIKDLRLNALIERNPTDVVSIISIPTDTGSPVNYRDFFYQIVSTLNFD